MLPRKKIDESPFKYPQPATRIDPSRRLALWLVFALILIIVQTTIAVAAPAVTLSATPTSRTVSQGQSAIYTINIARDNYTGNVSLSATNLPSGATASFNPNPTTGKSSTLTITTKASTPTGTFLIKCSGSAQGVTIAPINVTLVVTATSSASASAFPEVLSIIAGQTATLDISIARSNYAGPVYLSAANMPDGMTVSFDENPVYGNRTTMRVYSHGLPHVPREIEGTLNWNALEAGNGNLRFRLFVSCGLDWVEQFGSDQPDAAPFNSYERNGDVFVDGNGNVYVAGNTHGTIHPQYPNLGITDGFVAKYDSAGHFQWIAGIGTSEQDRIADVVVDSLGNVFVGGFTDGSFPGYFNRGNFDYWIAKYDSNGNFLWVHQDGTPGQDGRFGFAIVPDDVGGGKFVTFTAERTRVSTISFDPNGIRGNTSFFSLTSAYRNSPYDLAIGPNDTIYIVGFFENQRDPEPDNWYDNRYVVKYDNQGQQLWNVTSSTPNPSAATRIVVDSSGQPYVAGYSISPDTGADAWVSKYFNDGSSWTRTDATTATDLINAVGITGDGDLDGYGDLIIGGMTEGVLGEANGGAGPLGTGDAWVARRKSSNGDLYWVRQFAVADSDGINALAVDQTNAVILAGYTVSFKNNIRFEDALLLRYADSSTSLLLAPTITSFTPAQGPVGASITINGTNFSGITGVRLNGVAATYSVISPTAITFLVPSGATDGYVTISRSCDSFSSPGTFDVR